MARVAPSIMQCAQLLHPRCRASSFETFIVKRWCVYYLLVEPGPVAAWQELLVSRAAHVEAPLLCGGLQRGQRGESAGAPRQAAEPRAGLGHPVRGLVILVLKTVKVLMIFR